MRTTPIKPHSKLCSKLISIVLICFVCNSYAQDDSDNEDSWNFIIAPYLLSPNIDGDIGLGDVIIDVGVDPNDIFSHLDFGAMLFFEMNKGNWAITFDGLYMNLGKHGVTPIALRDIKADISQLELEFIGFYSVTDWLDLGIGGRVSVIKQGLYVGAGLLVDEIDVSGSNTWFDPLIASRASFTANEKWHFRLHTDIGGFGLGSDLAWQVHPALGYQFSPTFEFALGYRWLSMEYDKGSGADYYLYDLIDSGLELSFRFHL
ncbi:MAG: hypothetical protein BM564_00825 [Bacteroidetes bacterium MedPE-SWsnd-G2]|nr:MAG: hypothetical protein BM564_00825 [Bacteroidetes bacterium MedPE-SWsnd-G2]